MIRGPSRQGSASLSSCSTSSVRLHSLSVGLRSAQPIRGNRVKPINLLSVRPAYQSSDGSIDGSANKSSCTSVSTSSESSVASTANSSCNDNIANNSSTQASLVLYASLSALALGCAFFTGKAIAASVPAQPYIAQIHNPSSSSSSNSKLLPLASVVQSAATAAALRPPYRAPIVQRKDVTLNDALRYRVHQLFSLPAVGKILAVMAAAAPIVAIGGLAYRRAVADPDCTWQEALGKSYSVLNNCPGSSVESDRGFAADLVLHMVYLVGVFTFAVVLGIVTDDIKEQTDKVRKGNFPVIENHHTVLLNWNQQTLPVLKQMALARIESKGALFSGPVVVLADRSKEEMDAEIAEDVEGIDLRVFTRSGNPAKPSEQKRASAAHADTVVVLWPGELSAADASAQQAAVLAALKTAGGVEGQKVVVQSAGPDVADYDAVKLAVDLARSSTHSNQVVSLTTAGWERMHQIMAQVANQPGLEDVFADLLEYEDRTGEELGAEFYMEACPEQLAGQTYQHVRRSYQQATVVGWVAADDALRLNPRDTEVVPAGSQLVFVAGVADDAVHRLPEPYEVAPVRLRGRRGSHLPPQNITMLCFDSSSAEAALRNVMEFSSRGSHITVVCESPDEEALTALKRRGVRLSLVDGSPGSRAVLAGKSARLQQAQAVMICGLENREPAAADMQVIASVLQLQSLASQHSKRKQPLAIISTLNSTATEDVLWHTTLSFYAEQQAAASAAAEAAAVKANSKRKKGPLKDPAAAAAAAAAAVSPPVSLHLLRPDELMSGMLTQAAGAPQLASVFSELFAQETGHEVYLRDPKKSYGLQYEQPVPWSEIMELVRKRNETAIGFIFKNHGTFDRTNDRRGVRSGAAGQGATGISSSAARQLLGNQAEVHLAVHANDEVVLRPGDKLVVLALQ